MEYDRDNSGYMTFEEMPSLLRELGLPLDEPTLKKYVEARARRAGWVPKFGFV